MKSRREYLTWPATTAYEEQDPYYGQICLATLCAEEYGLFKIANRSDPKISNNPSFRPPHKAHIHICWAHGYAGLDCEHSVKGIPVSHASLLQSLVALLLDDWRSALECLPVHFHLHRGWPNPNSLKIGKGGKRWKDQKVPPLPSLLVDFLFARNNHVDFSASSATWKMPQEEKEKEKKKKPSHWWCGIALKCDLEEFGLRTALNGRDFYGIRSALPESISHLIVVEPSGGGSVFEILRYREGEELELRRVHSIESLVDPSGHPSIFFGDLRCHALNVLICVLEKMM